MMAALITKTGTIFLAYQINSSLKISRATMIMGEKSYINNSRAAQHVSIPYSLSRAHLHKASPGAFGFFLCIIW
jgi:hypothetical protein